MNDIKQETNIKFLFHQLVLTWEDFCRSHHLLFDYTCEEYLNLLASDINALESTLAEKDKILENINALDQERLDLIIKVSNSISPESEITKISELLVMVEGKVEQSAIDNLNKLNLLLIDIIVKLQAQNKKNQLFLNKSIISLNDLKSEFTGKKYSTYGPKGITNASTK
jgi:flagellar biosynthesis/type III secretory pathway chaperone